MRGIRQDSGSVKVLVEEVNLSSEQQGRGVEEIGRAMGQMQQVTQTTAANAEESAAAAEELNAQSEALYGIVNRLSLMFTDKESRHTSRRAA